MLRASSRPAKSGVVYGITHGGVVFALDSPTGVVRPLGTTWGSGYYATALALSDDGVHLYFAPFAPGLPILPPLKDAPIVQLDTRTGKRSIVALLGPELEQNYGYEIDQNYGVTVDDKEGRLYLTFNGRLKSTGVEAPCFVVLSTRAVNSTSGQLTASDANVKEINPAYHRATSAHSTVSVSSTDPHSLR